MKKSVINLINEVNDLCAFVQENHIHVVAYDGGTWPLVIDVEAVEVKNQFVYIREKDSESRYNYGFEKRYNTNKTGEYDMGGLKDLMYHLRLIRREYKKAFKYANNKPF